VEVFAVSERSDIISNARIVELERIIEDFKQKFKAGTNDAESFMTMTEIEILWGELQDKTNKLYSDMLMDMMRDVNEADLIRKKKVNTAPKA
jgi:hypothetical protein